MQCNFASITLCALLSAVSLAASPAQDQPTPPTAVQSAPAQPFDAKRHVRALSKRLALTADQQNQIQSILEDRQQQLAAISNDASLSARARRARVKEVRIDSETKIRGLLSEDQQKEYDQMQAERRERARTRRQTATNP